MKGTSLTLAVGLTLLVAVQLRAGVRVSPSPDRPTPETATPTRPAPDRSTQSKERLVAFRVSENEYVTAVPSGCLDLSGAKVGSKQRFMLIDLNGGELVDGDQVRVEYVPNTESRPNPSKASYWRVDEEGIRRGHEGDAFRIKRVGTKYVFQTLGGKFVTRPVVAGSLGLSDKQEGALLLEFVDLSEKPATE